MYEVLFCSVLKVDNIVFSLPSENVLRELQRRSLIQSQKAENQGNTIKGNLCSSSCTYFRRKSDLLTPLAPLPPPVTYLSSRLRWAPSLYTPTSQPVVAHRKLFFPDRSQDCFFIFLFFFSPFFLFSLVFEPFFLCAHHEGTNQAPIATAAVSTYRKPSRIACNRPCTEQHSIYSSTFVSTRVRQRMQADKSKLSLPRAPMYEYFVFFFFVL